MIFQLQESQSLKTGTKFSDWLMEIESKIDNFVKKATVLNSVHLKVLNLEDYI